MVISYNLPTTPTTTTTSTITTTTTLSFWSRISSCNTMERMKEVSIPFKYDDDDYNKKKEKMFRFSFPFFFDLWVRTMAARAVSPQTATATPSINKFQKKKERKETKIKSRTPMKERPINQWRAQ